MDYAQARKSANIKDLHDVIDNTSRVDIEKKSDLVRDLNRRKNLVVDSIENALKKCRYAERAIYTKWQNKYDRDAYNQLEEYNMYLKEQHDKGSELIGAVNAAKNFQQLNMVENEMVNPFISSLETNCGVYSRHSSLMNSHLSHDVNVRHSGYTDVKTRGDGKTNIDVRHHSQGATVNVSKEEAPGSPSHNITVSSNQGPVRVTHQPSSAPVSSPAYSQPVYSPAPVRVVQPVRTVAVSPAPVRTVAVRPVQQVRAVQPVRVVQPAPVRTVAVQPVKTVAVSPAPVRTVAVTPAPVSTVAVVPIGSRAVVTHDYYPSSPENKLALKKGTVVNVDRYSGDWALVTTANGHRGYISRFYLRPL